MIYPLDKWQRPDLSDTQSVAARVGAILQDVQVNGSIAIKNASEKYDGFAPEVIALKPFAAYELPASLADAIAIAAMRITRFAEQQRASLKDFSFKDAYGEYGQTIVPMRTAAAYIPGGRFPLISTALMTLIPARVAGCNYRTAFSPSINPALLAAASLAGATQFVRLGGAQAIAAAAMGSEWNSASDIIVGPGNAYVAEAKAQLQNRVAIDTVAGPSEVLILADDTQNSEWLVEDAIAQAEHGPDALAVIVSESEAWLKQTLERISNCVEASALLKRRQIQLLLSASIAETIEFTNAFAAEHLMICNANIRRDQVFNAGAVFVGALSPVAMGDYLSGPNHTLPTLATAKRSSGLSVLNFLRVQTWQRIESGHEIYAQAAQMADAEGLMHHANSLRLRI